MRIGEWVVETPWGPAAWRCHRVDAPFRKAILTQLADTDNPELTTDIVRLVGLSSPNIAGVLGLVEGDGASYLAREDAPGVSLDGYVDARGSARLPAVGALEVALQLCDAITAAHAQGVVHGSLSPEYVVVGSDGRVRVCGFEPLVEFRSEDATVAGDRHGLGVLLSEVLTGVARTRSPTGSTPPPLDPSLPAALRRALAALCDRDPSRRPPIPEVRAHLQDAYASRPSRSEEGRSRLYRSGSSSLSGGAAAAPGEAPTRIGRYDVVRELGRGGAGVVYEAEDGDLHRRVAIKVLLAGTYARSRDIQRFKREAQAVARLDHPGIVKVLDIGSHLDGAWFAMEFVDGPSLSERLRTVGRMPWPEAVGIVARMARALQHAHEAGLLHRDVKPQNVLMEGGHDPKLADFGLAYDADAEQSRMTGTGQILGTPMYMAPEQATGDLSGLGPHTDVYGLGVMLYETLTGVVPYDGANPIAVIGRILTGNPKSPRELEPSVPRMVETACLKAFRLDPKDRYDSAAAFAEDLERCLRGQPILAAKPTRTERLRWYVRSNAVFVGVSLAVLISGVGAALGVGAVSALQASQVEAERQAFAREAWEGTRARIEVALAAGDDGLAEQLFRNYVVRPEHQGTTALVEAWWNRAATFRQRGEGPREVSALASAYGVATGDEDLEESLRLLAEAARRERQFGLLAGVLDNLKQRESDLLRLPSLRSLTRDSALAARQLSVATQAGADPNSGPGRLLAAFSATTRTGRRGRVMGPWPDGRLWMVEDGVSRLVPATAALTGDATLHGLPELSGRAAAAFEIGADVWVAWSSDEGTHVSRVDGDHFTAGTLLGTERRGGNRVVAADLDGDRSPEVYFTGARHLWRARAIDGDFPLDAPSPEIEAANSEITDLTTADLDGDGRAELVVAAGEWSGYDVTVLTADAGGTLAPHARQKLGYVGGVVAVRGPAGPSLMACKQDLWPNARVFPPETPLGVGQGWWELVPSPTGLEPVRRSQLPCADAEVGDFDGDGLDDLAENTADGGTALWIRRADGAFDDVYLPGLSVAAAAQLDDDDATELIVSASFDEGRLWVLGAGSDTLPPVESRVAVRRPGPPADPVFGAAWARSEDLVSLGQETEAAELLHDLATVREGRVEGNAALLRAAELQSAAGAHSLAATWYREADRAGVPDTLRLVAHEFREARDDRSELEVLLELERRGDESAELHARLVALRGLSERPTVSASFETSLDPHWQVLDPFAVHRDRSRGTLAVTALGSGVLARLPVDWDGKWLEVEVELEIGRTEWGSGLTIGLAPRQAGGAPVVGVSLSGNGGGDLVHTEARCASDQFQPAVRVVEKAGSLLRMAVFFQPTGELWCAIDQAPVRLGTTGVDPSQHPAWDLVLWSNAHPGSVAEVSIRQIALSGASIDATTAVSDDAAFRLADGDPSSAAETDSVTILAAAAADRGDQAALKAALIRLGPAHPEVWQHLLHPRLEWYGGVARTVAGADWFTRFSAAWDSVLLDHPASDDVLSEALLRELDGIEQVVPRTDQERQQLALLLARRGAVAGRRSLFGVAVTALERALELTEATPIPEPSVRWRIQSAALELAVVAVNEGDEDGAFAWLTEWVAKAPSATIARDMMEARTELRRLHADPRWAAVMGR